MYRVPTDVEWRFFCLFVARAICPMQAKEEFSFERSDNGHDEKFAWKS